MLLCIPGIGPISFITCGGNLGRFFSKMQQYHGGVFGFNIGSSPTVVVCSYEVYKASLDMDGLFNHGLGSTSSFHDPKRDKNGKVRW
jgi:hypothetical protein